MIYVITYDTIEHGISFHFVDADAIQKTKDDIRGGALDGVRLIEAQGKPDESYKNEYHVLVISNREFLSNTPRETIINRCLQPVEKWVNAT